MTGAGDRVAERVVLALFFGSGFAALLYQVVWQRVLAVFSGADVYSVTIIVAAFMGGLGCGSLAGGHAADRVTDRARVALFAVCEVAVALFALGSLWLYHDLLPRWLPNLAGSRPGLAAVLFASLLWPTFFMGMSLPLLARALTRRAERAADVVGALYGANTLGAAAGAFLTTWLFTRVLGFEGTVRLGAALNLAAAAGAVLVAPRLLRGGGDAGGRGGVALGAGDEAPVPTTSLEGDPGPRAFPVPVWIALYGLAGFVALSLEIVWFRLLGVAIKSTAFSFGNLLAVYLAGLAAGTFGGLRWARRSRRPALAFLALQAAIPIYAGVSLLLLGAVGNVALAAPLWSYLGGYEPVDVGAAVSALARYATLRPQLGPDAGYTAKQFLMLYVAVPLLVVGPPTVMMGLSFPLLQRVVQRDVATLGRRVGWLQTANIAGSMLGAILTGWVLLRLLGTPATVRALLAAGAVFLLPLALHAGRGGRAGPRLLAAAGAAAAVGALAWRLPNARALWAALHGTTPDRVIAAEDGSGLSVLRADSAGFRGEVTVYANGLGQSAVPFPRHHITLGLVPVMLHPNPRRVAIVGLGSGATLYAAGGRRETAHVTCIEIVAPQLTTLRHLARVKPDAGLAALLGDGRVAYRFADARAVIALGGERYDVIEADALRPTSAYAGNLYSTEYFALLRRHLAPGGFAVSWAPTERVIGTFVRVFPHAVLYTYGGVRLLVGSDQPVAWDGAALAARLGSDFSRAYYARAGVRIAPYLEAFAATRPLVLRSGDARPGPADVNTDLFPRDEYLVPRPR